MPPGGRGVFLDAVEHRYRVMTFEPGMPNFSKVGPTTWRETVWSKQRCVFCPEPLAPGDKIACEEHRKRLDQEETS